MSGRLAGEHFNPDGRPKRAYETWVLADAFAKEYGLTAYECSVCGKWHLASPPARAEEPERRTRRRPRR